MGFPALPLLSAAAELFVVNLVAQHDPQADTQFVRRRNPRLAHPFLDKLATIEAFQLRIFSYRMDRRFGPQIAQQRVALLGQFPQPLPLTAGVFTRDHSDVAGDLVTVGEALGSPRNTSVANAVTGPTPGCVNKRSAWGRCWTCFSTCPSSSWIRCCNCTYKRSSSSRL